MLKTIKVDNIFLVVLLFLFSLSFLCGGCGREEFVVYRVRADSFADHRIDPVRSIAERALPSCAKDIWVERYTGCLVGGASVVARCVVNQDALRQFAKERNLNFRFDSTYANENPGLHSRPVSSFSLFSDFLEGKIKPGKYQQKPYEKEVLLCDYSTNGLPFKVSAESYRDTYAVVNFWSYSYLYPSNGGTRYFYDVERAVLYYSWSSN